MTGHVVVVADVAALGRVRLEGLAADGRRPRLAAQALEARARAGLDAHRRASAARSSARRSRRPSSSPTRRRARRLPRRARGELSAASPSRTSRRAATRRAHSAARSSGCSARSARRCSARSSTRMRKPGETVGTSGVEATYDRFLNGGFDRARVRVDSMGRVVGRLQRGHAARAADAAADDRRAPPARRRQGDPRRHRARARERPPRRAGRSGRRDEPVDGRASTRSRAIRRYNQVAAAQDPQYSREPLQGPAPTRPAEPGDAGRLSDRLDVQADRRRGGALRGDHHAVDPAALQRLVHGRQRRSSTTSRRASTRACRCRPRSRSRATRGSTGSATSSTCGAARGCSTGRSCSASGTRPASTCRARRRGSCRRPPGSRRRYHEPWYEGQSINLSIGQGYLQVTPLQLAVAYSALVNGGTVVRPHVAQALLRGESVQTLKFKPVRKVKLDRRVGDQAGALRRGARRRTAPRRRSSRTSRSRSRARPARRSRAPAGATTPGTRRGRRQGTRRSSSSC